MIDRLTDHTIVIRLDAATAVAVVLGVLALTLYTRQAYGLIRDLVPLIRSIHFNLVQAPFEAAVNAARSALDDAGE